MNDIASRLEKQSASCVLIVDDEPTNIKLLEKVLRPLADLRIVSTTKGADALALFRTNRPDLVLLDLHMPGMDGLEVMSAIREVIEHEDFVPFVVLTADISPQSRVAALTAGADDFLTKPLDASEVVLRVRNLLRTRTLYLIVQHDRARLAEQLREREATELAEERRLADVAARIRDVLTRGNIEIVFQPILDLVRNSTIGYEALSRFSAEPVRSPDHWFADANEVGLGRDLELLAIDIALRSLERIPEELFLSVNISPDLVANGELSVFLGSRAATRLVIELTEHARIDDYAPLISQVTELRKRGLQFAVDDAGAGFASLQHILRLRPDIIKLDLTLTRGIDGDPVRRALASSMAFFGNEVGAHVLAEGIETEAEQKTLCKLGVHLGQGYHLGRPGALRFPTSDEVAVRTAGNDVASLARLQAQHVSSVEQA